METLRRTHMPTAGLRSKSWDELEARIKIFTSLRLDALDRMSLQHRLNEIGTMRREAVLE